MYLFKDINMFKPPKKKNFLNKLNIQGAPFFLFVVRIMHLRSHARKSVVHFIMFIRFGPTQFRQNINCINSQLQECYVKVIIALFSL